MIKKWIYIHFDESTGRIASGKEFKQAIVWDEVAPDEDYQDVTTEADRINYKADLYLKRSYDGVAYSNLMNVKIDEISADFFDVPTMTYLKDVFNTDEDGVIEMAKEEIVIFFKDVQTALEQGKYKSAQRMINRLDPASVTFVREQDYNDVKNYIDNYVLESYQI